MADDLILIVEQAKKIALLVIDVEDLKKENEAFKKQREEKELQIKELEKQREASEKRMEELEKKGAQSEKQIEEMKVTIETLWEALEQALTEGCDGADKDMSGSAVALERPSLSCAPGLVAASTTTAAMRACAAPPPPAASGTGARPRVHAAASSPANAHSVSRSSTLVPSMTREEVEAKSEEFLEAAEMGRAQDVRRLLMQGADASYKDAIQCTALHYVAQNNHVEIVLALLSAGASVDAANLTGITPLHCATLNGHKETLRALIKAGATVNARDRDNWTPLHLAALDGRIECAEALLRAGADLIAVNNNRETPLNLARKHGMRACAKLLWNAPVYPKL